MAKIEKKIPFGQLKGLIIEEMKKSMFGGIMPSELKIAKQDIKKVKSIKELISFLDRYGLDDEETYRLCLSFFVKDIKIKS